MRVTHRTTIVSKCPHGGTDVYEAEFVVENRTLTVEKIQKEIDDLTATAPLYQEELTQRLADCLNCLVVTMGTHGKFQTECRAGAIL